MDTSRHYTAADNLITEFSAVLNTLFVKPRSRRPFPADQPDSDKLTESERQQSGRYMRVNHVGEICAQALYHSQAITARDPEVRESMRNAADEEVDHLAWCEQRIEESAPPPE